MINENKEDKIIENNEDIIIENINSENDEDIVCQKCEILLKEI